eukprot:758403-Hanusia_phi.AAC.5
MFIPVPPPHLLSAAVMGGAERRAGGAGGGGGKDEEERQAGRRRFRGRERMRCRSKNRMDGLCRKGQRISLAEVARGLRQQAKRVGWREAMAGRRVYMRGPDQEGGQAGGREGREGKTKVDEEVMRREGETIEDRARQERQSAKRQRETMKSAFKLKDNSSPSAAATASSAASAATPQPPASHSPAPPGPTQPLAHSGSLTYLPPPPAEVQTAKRRQQGGSATPAGKEEPAAPPKRKKTVLPLLHCEVRRVKDGCR